MLRSEKAITILIFIVIFLIIFISPSDNIQRCVLSEDISDEIRQWCADFRIQEKSFINSVLMTILTALGIYLLWRTLSATEQALNDSRIAANAACEAVEVARSTSKNQVEIARASAAQLREDTQNAHAALLLPSTASIFPVSETTFVCDIKFVNVGQSLATDVFHASTLLGRTSQAHGIAQARSFDLSSLQLKHVMYAASLPSKLSVKVETGGPDFLRLLGCPYFLYWVGVVVWRDVFGTWRAYKYGFILNVPVFGPVPRPKILPTACKSLDREEVAKLTSRL
ncbi:MAG: hypothetical protein AAGH41_09415 [Pseudomonadota bacterium]